MIVKVIVTSLVFFICFLFVGNTEFNSAFPYIHIKNLWRAIGFFLIFIGLCIFETSAYHRGVKDGEQEVINILKENEE